MCGWAAGLGRKATIGGSKQFLRELGEDGANLASRLANISRLRNTEVHDENRAFLSELANFCGLEGGMFTQVAASSPAPSTVDFFELSVAEVVKMQDAVAKEHVVEKSSSASMSDLIARDNEPEKNKLVYDNATRDDRNLPQAGADLWVVEQKKQASANPETGSQATPVVAEIGVQAALAGKDTAAACTQTALYLHQETGSQTTPVVAEIGVQATLDTKDNADQDLSADLFIKLMNIGEKMDDVNRLLVNFKGPPRHWPRESLQLQVAAAMEDIASIITESAGAKSWEKNG